MRRRRSGGRRRWQRYGEGQRNCRTLSTGIAHGYFDFVLAISQLFRRNREDLVADDLARPVVESDFDSRDVRLSTSSHFDILGPLQDRVNHYAAEFDCRR